MRLRRTETTPAETTPMLTQGPGSNLAEFDVVSFAGRVIDFGNLEL